MKKLCPNCGKHPARKHPIYGRLPCLSCQKKREQQTSPNVPVELTTNAIKEERGSYGKSIIQPYRSGEVSKEFVDTFPNKAKTMFTEKERTSAKPVWTDLHSVNTDVSKTK